MSEEDVLRGCCPLFQSGELQWRATVSNYLGVSRQPILSNRGNPCLVQSLANLRGSCHFNLGEVPAYDLYSTQYAVHWPSAVRLKTSAGRLCPLAIGPRVRLRCFYSFEIAR